MTYDETLKALRCCTDSPRTCSECPAKGDQLFCVQKIEMEAASAIESLQKEVETLEAERDWWKLCVRTLPQMPKWINAEEVRPEEAVPVLCLCRFGPDPEGRTVYACEVMSMRPSPVTGWDPYWEDSHRNAIPYELVTHWMPLPALPKEVET